jgi:acyl carrier protein
MISRSDALHMIQQTLTSLHDSGMLEKEVTVQDSTPLMGTGTSLDSLAFVNFITELEDRLNSETSRDNLLLVTEVAGWDGSCVALTAGALAEYISRVTS